MKIALIHTPLWGRGGAERQVLMLAIELQKLGNEVELFTPVVNREDCYPELMRQVIVRETPQNRFIPFKQNNVSTSSTNKIGEISNNRNPLRRIAVNQFYALGLPSMLRLGKSIPKGFDIINNHNAPTEWAAFEAKKKLKVPIVWMCNEPPSWFYFAPGRGIRKKLTWPLFEIWDKTSVRYIDDIAVLSLAAEKLVKNIYKRPARVVRTGVDSEKFKNVSGNEIRKKYGLENDFVLLSVCNLAPIKRPADSIIALHFLSKQHDNVKLIFDGSGPRENLIKLIEKLGLKEKVLFLHSKSDEELVKVYASCDAFVFPPQITWGLAVTEAMAASKPVIVSNACGASEIIEDNFNGMIFEHAKPEQISKKVELLINDQGLRRSIGRNAFEYVATNLSWKNYAKTMEGIFQQSISQRE
jgi:glycosyltransferase involved in cell wall biosynthesis